MGGTEWAKFGLGIDWTCVNMQAVLPDRRRASLVANTLQMGLSRRVPGAQVDTK
jgi:hypothetical protein